MRERGEHGRSVKRARETAGAGEKRGRSREEDDDVMVGYLLVPLPVLVEVNALQ
jgi:hypothetical protein